MLIRFNMRNQKKRKPKLFVKLRNYFITGIVVLVPIGITLYLTMFFISISSNLIPKEINPNSYLPFSIPGLEILLSIIFITVIGGLSLFAISKRNFKKNSNIKNNLFSYRSDD